MGEMYQPQVRKGKGSTRLSKRRDNRGCENSIREGHWTGAGASSRGNCYCRLHPGGRERMPYSRRSTELGGEGTQ